MRGGNAVTIAVLLPTLLQSVLSSCPRAIKGDLICSWRGECSPDDRCLCEPGFRGADCSERTCPTGNPFAFFGLEPPECSGRGTCNRDTGTCACHPAYFGYNCERLRCGGGVGDECSLHGLCLSVEKTAARHGKVYADTDSAETTTLFGCFCDPGWTGHDCSLAECPRGDDPMTIRDSGGRLQVNELQLLQCELSENKDPWTELSKWNILFKGEQVSVHHNMSATQLQVALLSMPVIQGYTLPFFKQDVPHHSLLCSLSHGARWYSLQLLELFSLREGVVVKVKYSPTVDCLSK